MTERRMALTPDQMVRLEELARAHPRGQDEGILKYIERLAVIAGLVKQEDTALLSEASTVEVACSLLDRAHPPRKMRPAPGWVRLPYRESDDSRRIDAERRTSEERAAADAIESVSDDDVPF